MKIYDIEKQRGLDVTMASEAFALAKATAPLMHAGQSEAEKYYKGEYAEEDKEWMSKWLPEDSMLIHAVLVSTNWNKNDDVFTPEDTLKAAYTPRLKPVNMEHMGRESVGENKTVGIIVNSETVDEKLERCYLSMDSQETLPELFHIVIGMHIWELYFPTSAKEIREGAKKGDMFVSMECFFKDFGYALRKEGSDEVSLLPRSEITAWLSSYLRALGGEGKVEINGQTYSVGRWLRDIVFSGVGFVKQPANDSSIVFEDYISHAEGSFKKLDESDWGIENEKFVKNNKKSVFNISKAEKSLWLIK